MVILVPLVVFLIFVLCGVAGAGIGVLASAILPKLDTDAAGKYGFLWGLVGGVILLIIWSQDFSSCLFSPV